MAFTCLGVVFRGGRFKCVKMGWPSHRKRKKNFFINISVGLSMCECPIGTVKYILVNMWCILN